MDMHHWLFITSSCQQCSPVSRLDLRRANVLHTSGKDLHVSHWQTSSCVCDWRSGSKSYSVAESIDGNLTLLLQMMGWMVFIFGWLYRKFDCLRNLKSRIRFMSIAPWRTMKILGLNIKAKLLKIVIIDVLIFSSVWYRKKLYKETFLFSFLDGSGTLQRPRSCGVTGTIGIKEMTGDRR